MRNLILIIVVTIACLTLASCNEDKLKDAVKGIGELAMEAGQATYSNPEVLAAYATDGWDGVKRVGLPIFWSNLKLQAVPLANGGDAERALYDLIMEESPLVARMIYRETELGPDGIWIDLNTAAQSVGYDGANFGLVLVLTSEQWDWLAGNIGPLALQHYNAVKAEGKSITNQVNGIALGGE